jgi:methylenetetrahydrofolate dehydrogenase (NADP+)/methenyltetrahydrofolate cyclohydrolase
MSSKKVNSTVTICHTGTKDVASIVKQADIIVAAAGHPMTVTKDMVKPGAVVIDVGVNRIPDDSKRSGFRLVGDSDFDDLVGKVSYITPVPGGVGPMTIAMLMQNTLESAQKQILK